MQETFKYYIVSLFDYFLHLWQPSWEIFIKYGNIVITDDGLQI